MAVSVEIGTRERLLEVPGALAGVAVKHRAFNLAVAQEQAAVIAALNVVVIQHLMLGAGLGGAKGVERYTANFEFGSAGSIRVALGMRAAQRRGEHFYLTPDRLHQAVGGAIELAALAQR